MAEPGSWLLEPDHLLPIVHVRVVVLAGSAADPPGHAGLARHAAELMCRGSGARSRSQFEQDLDALGAELEVDSGLDAVTFTARCMTSNLPRVVACLAEVLARPRIEQEEHERLCRESLAFLHASREEDWAIACRFFNAYALEGHPYGRSGLGTEASLTRMRREDVLRWIHRNIFRDRVIIGFAGDVDERTARDLSGALLDALPAAAPDRVGDVTLDAPVLPQAGRTVLVDKPDRSQCHLLIGHVTPSPDDPDHPALQVASEAFGGNHVARLRVEVRMRRGWSYDANTWLQSARVGHTFRINAAPAAERLPDTVELCLALWRQMIAEGITSDELAAARRSVQSRLLFARDTAHKRLIARLETKVLGVVDDFHERWLDRVNALTLDEIHAAMHRRFHPDRATIVVTGTDTPMSAGSPLSRGRVDVMRFDLDL
jgi:zinc protease